MAKFTYQVDRQHQVVAPISLYADEKLTGTPITLNPGDKVVYKGIVEIDGQPRWVFTHAGGKGYAKNHTELDAGLVEDYDALVQASNHFVEVS